MKNIGIYFGSTTGTTEKVAQKIAEALGVSAEDLHDVAKTSPSDVGNYKVLIFGTSTWGDGELQDDMADFIDGVKVLDLKDKKIAVFGCGDESMSETFCDGVGILYDDLARTGAKMIGSFNDNGYSYEHSDAVKDGVAEGLIIDNVNHEDLTDSKIKSWTDEIKKEIG